MNKEALENLKTGDTVYATIIFTDSVAEPDLVEFSGQTEIEVSNPGEFSASIVFKDAENKFDWPISEFEEPYAETEFSMPKGTMVYLEEQYDVIVTDDPEIFNQMLDKRIALSEAQHQKRAEALNKGRV